MKKTIRLLLPALAGMIVSISGCSPDKDGDSQTTGEAGVVNLIPSSGLDGFVPFLTEESPVQDPAEVWQVEDGMLHITGRGWGYLRSEKEYSDYHLTVEYRWGEFTAAARENRARDSGIFVHADANDRAFRDSWVSSFEAQMIEGRAGDIIVIAALNRDTGRKAPHRLTTEAEETQVMKRPGDYLFKPGATTLDLPHPRLERVRIFRDPHDTEWNDEKGYRTSNEIEKPAGDWNTLEVKAAADTLEIILNGRTVNRATGVTPAKGHLCLQSELSECWIRKWELRPLTE